MYVVSFIVFLVVTLCQLEAQDVANQTKGRSVVLSRRKRFLVFPEGSSLQLVFCNTFPNISPMGDIVLWGYTAALAYELPQDPYSPFDHHGDPLHRRADSKAIYYTDEDGKLLHKRPYHRKFIVNPAFAKRSVGADEASSPQFKKATREKLKLDRKLMHASKSERQLFFQHMDRGSVEFHRSSRGSLYQKIETMLRGLGGNGRQCLLKTLCLVKQTTDLPQGSFFQEILRAVFTLPNGQKEDEFSYEYDEAISTTTPCEQAYPDCEGPLSETSAPTLNY